VSFVILSWTLVLYFVANYAKRERTERREKRKTQSARGEVE
jgi:hypothetical protein